MDGLPDCPKPLSIKMCLSAAQDLKVHNNWLKCETSVFYTITSKKASLQLPPNPNA